MKEQKVRRAKRIDGWMDRWIICLFALNLCFLLEVLPKENNIKILGIWERFIYF
jgi:hypothetical protein